jgi:iron complex outermembrane receptor protein
VIFQADLNGIPLSMIDRIEVLPTGASAIYGGGSIGGVVDVILKKDYTGGNLTATYSNTMNVDTPTRRIAGIYGFSLEGGKTQVTISGSLSASPAFELQDRRFILDYFHRVLQNRPGLIYSNALPPPGATPNIALYTSPYTGKSNTGFVYGPAFTNPNNTSLVLKNGVSLNSPITYIPYGLAPGSPNLASALLADAGQYNLATSPGTTTDGLTSDFGLNQNYKAIVASVQRAMTKDITVYVDFNTNSSNGSYTYTQWTSNLLIIPGNAPGNPFNDNVRITMPVSVKTPAYQDLVNQSVSTGATIKLPFDWTSLLDFTWTDVQKEYKGFTGGLDGPTGGSYTNSIDQDSASGALSPFFDTLAYPIPNLVKYNLSGMGAETTTLNDLSLRASGPLPWIDKLVGTTTLTVGLEHRKEGLKNGYTAPLYADQLPSPENRATTVLLGQDQSTNSGYAELDSSLIEPKRNIPLVNSLSLQAAVRTELYSVNTGTVSYTYADFPQYQTAQYGGPSTLFTPGYSGGVTTPFRQTDTFTATKPTFGLKYNPIPSLAFRGSYSSAFVAPTFAQLLVAPFQSVALTTITDPANGQTYGVPTLGGGNAATKPQTSEDWDYGVIYEPRNGWLKGFRASLDYYRIIEDNVITTYPNVQYIVNNVPSRVTRNPATGLITVVDNTNTNLLGLRTSGFDTQLNYITDTPIGTISISLLGTIIEHLKKQTTVGQPFLEYNQYVASGGTAKSKGSASLVWKRGNLRAGWTTTYVDSYMEDLAPGDPAYGPVANPAGSVQYTVALGHDRVSSQVYHNVFAAYTFGQEKPYRLKHHLRDYIADGATLSVGIDDLFNTPPPFDPFFSPYYFSPFGSVLLRTYTINLSLPF